MNLKDIKALVFDFDGVFTDNRVIISDTGEEFVICNRSDGIGLKMLKELKIPMKIISSEKNKVVSHRAKKLKLPVVHGVSNKLGELKLFSKHIKIDFKNFAYVGNDINDLDCMKAVGFPVAVNDAFKEIIDISKLVLDKPGGKGAVRELCEKIRDAYINGK